ncbi:MAG: hypothetical protein JO307_09085 [Bryobacterales bacterium]|nr:hypothetical protein [Bryobacterales bacterium]MBV9401651.1 hypothetical protein [Bryobacterales bacterium]
METVQTFQDVVELAKGAHYTIVLDEHLRALKPGLEDEGFKVVLPRQGAGDSEIKELAKGGWTIATRNSRDFIDDALHYDYDVIAVEDVKFIDTKPDRSNQTVAKIAGAIMRSQLASRKGNFILRVRDDGSFHLRQLP